MSNTYWLMDRILTSGNVDSPGSSFLHSAIPISSTRRRITPRYLPRKTHVSYSSSKSPSMTSYHRWLIDILRGLKHTRQYKQISKVRYGSGRWSSSINFWSFEYPVLQPSRPKSLAYSTRHSTYLPIYRKLVLPYRLSWRASFYNQLFLHRRQCHGLNYSKTYLYNWAPRRMSARGTSRRSSHLLTANPFVSTHPLRPIHRCSGPGLIRLTMFNGEIIPKGQLLHRIHTGRPGTTHLHDKQTSQSLDNNSQPLRISVPLATQPLTISRLRSTIFAKAILVQVTQISSQGDPVCTAGLRAIGDRHAQSPAKTPVCKRPTSPYTVAPLPVSPVRQHLRTTRLLGLIRIRWFDQPWARMQQVRPTPAQFWILGQPITGHLRMGSGDGTLAIPKVMYSPEMTGTLLSLGQLIESGFLPQFLPSNDIVLSSPFLTITAFYVNRSWLVQPNSFHPVFILSIPLLVLKLPLHPPPLMNGIAALGTFRMPSLKNT